MDVFEGPTSQDLGEEKREGVVYSIVLKRMRYTNQTMSPPNSHLRWVSQKVRGVVAGTLEKLVEHLAPDPGVMDVSHTYRTCFLCTYRSFSDTGRVVELLVKRYLSLAWRPEDAESETKRAVQEEIIQFLRLWLETYPQDFCSLPSHPHLSTLEPLIQGSHDLKKMIGTLRDGGSHTDTRLLSDAESDGPQHKPVQSVLFSMSPEDFANSLTTEDARLFLQVSPPQCLDYIRSPRDTTNAPTVRACIQHFNRVSLVVIATILGGVAPNARAFLLGQWIDIAQHCRVVRNFSSLKAVVSGLQSTAVFRLSKTWERVSNSKLQLFQELSDLLSVDDNHQSSRDLLNREGTAKYSETSAKKGKGRTGKCQSTSVIGVVPYLGTFLTDLTMIDSAHQDKTQDGLINFEKFRRLFQQLAELTLYQKSAANYCFDSNHQLLHWLRNTHTTAPSESYELSRQLEPSEGHTLPVPDTSQATMSPARIRRGLKQLFSMKGSTVGDYTPPHSGTLTISTSVHDLTASPSPSTWLSRSSSVSPSIERRRGSVPTNSLLGISEAEGRVVRVAFTNSDHCNYKSIQLGVTDKAHSIIQRSLSMLGIAGEAKQYNLFQVIGDKHQLLPSNANVFYALSNETYPTLVINRVQIT